MSTDEAHSKTVTIENRLGFHVRPVQRFSELARAFEGDVKVEIGGKKADGKSVMGLMSLGAKSGSEMTITTQGIDARQALDLLSFLASNRFFVEDRMDDDNPEERHIERLVKFSSCFDSDIEAEIEGERVDASDPEALRQVGLEPTSPVKFHIEGEDQKQASEVLEKLVDYRFYVEEAMGAESKNKG